jgi:hypothetical protein
MGKEPQASGSFGRLRKYEPGNDRIEWLIGNESIEVGGDKPRPIASTGRCCALLGFTDGRRFRVDSHH